MIQQLKESIINDTNSTVLVDELMKKHTKYMFPTEDLMHSFDVNKKVNISKNIKKSSWV